ncbi:hypothetical protein CSC74_09140 [Pseudoxanthomonas yeongjuensis]|uniref:alpha/beta hydrolase family protein n=1 Tax=Pseudoxanthomonas yeongjuensis TaxID=377616 RepID=UPI001390DE70|nr:prolyl oligopeptidase family serine peptidase [Pseudoxanthomonas yeongjuensis]KAF1717015.1 hypothetical protein CSC74_09140 [Pseudoxanthomonas yeongjuensis]
MKASSVIRLFVPLILVAGSLHAAESKPFTPELMLQNEDVGEVRFSADGSQVYLDKYLPYRDKQHFDRERDWGRGLSVLSIVDAATGKDSALRKSPQDRTWYIGSSPGGDHVAFGWFDGDTQRIGLLDPKSGKEQRLALAATTSPLPLLWLSAHELVIASMDAGQQDKMMASDSYSLRKIGEMSRKSWQGLASVKVAGSGRYRSKPNDQPVSLALVDARSGQVRQIDAGTLAMVQVPSPAGGSLAYLRKSGSFDMAGIKVEAIIGVETINELNIYDLSKGKTTVRMCDGCSVDDGSLRWSPSGRQLYYSVRFREGGKFTHQHFIYDVQAGESSRFQTPGLAWDTEVEQARFLAPVLWLDESHLAVRTRNKEAGEFGNQEFRWNLVTRGGEVVKELSAGLPRGEDKQALKLPAAVHQGALLLIADGRLWRVPVEGKAVNLTEKLGADVDTWCAPYAPWRMANPRCDAMGSDSIFPPIEPLALQRGRVALRIMRDGAFTGEFAFVDLASGQIARLKRPTEDSAPLEVSAFAQAAVFQRKGNDGDEVLLVRNGAAPVSLYRFNTHLAGVEAAKPVLLTRREAGEDEDRNDWLLLPPDHKPGDRHPLLVYFYPDTRYRKELKGDDLRDISFLNKNIPAARGYAVLMASMKISDYGTAGGNPMREMHEQLIRAAENAVAKGYVDPDRWAIMGHSYGGYGTNSVITQTGRFKAAISMDGPSNLTSGYGIGMNQDKAYAVPEGLNFGALWSEGGQGRMGVPPWRDPQRYIDNSPVFWAHQITTPLMLIHGDLDFVNVNEAEQLFAALHREGKDVQLVRYWGEGHVYNSPGNITDMWNRIFEFLDQNLQSAPGAQKKVSGL